MLILARVRSFPALQRKTLNVQYIDPTIASCHDVRHRTRVAQGDLLLRRVVIPTLRSHERSSNVEYDVGGRSFRDRERLTFGSQCRNMCGLCVREHGPRFNESATTSVTFLNDGVLE